MWGEILGGVLSSYLQSEASKDAAQTQSNSGAAANAQTWEMYQQNRADMMPWRQTGVAALGKLNGYMGLGQQGMNPVQAAGAINSKGGQDTILAHINPQEATVLKQMGGSGRVDPVTGGVHFEDNDEGGGGDMGGWDGGDRSRGAGNNMDSASRAYDAMGNSALAGGTGYGSGRLNDGMTRMGFNWKKGLTGFGSMGIPGLMAGITRTAYNPGDSYNPGGMNPNKPIERDRDGGDGYQTGGFNMRQPASSGAPIAAEGAYTQPLGGTQSGSFGDWDRNFTMADYQADPGYQFRLNQGSQTLERSAAARGGLNSGALGKALTQYGQEMGSQEYGSAYNRWNNDIGNRFNRLSTLAGMGQSATGQVGNYGMNASNTIGNNLTDMGNAQAAGQIGSANAWQNGINGALNAWNQWNVMNGGR